MYFQIWITKDNLENQISILLKSIEISEKFKNWAIGALREENKRESRDRTQIYENLQDKYNKNQSALDKLLDLRLQELILDDEYKQKKEVLIKEKEGLKEHLDDTECRADKWLELTENTFNFARYARYWFSEGTPKDKKTILSTIGSNLILKDGKLHVDAKDHFKVIQRAVLEVPSISSEFEPAETGSITVTSSDSFELNPSWLGGMDTALQ